MVDTGQSQKHGVTVVHELLLEMNDMLWYRDTIHKIVEFFYEGKRARSNIAPDIAENILRDTLRKKMLKSRVFVNDLACYRRAKDRSNEDFQDPEYTLEFLERCLKRCIGIQHDEKVR